MRKVFRELIDLERAQELLMSYELPRKAEEVPLLEVIGRILAEDIISDVDVPSFDRAAMDGYAIRAEDTFWADEDNPVQLRVVGRSAAGHPFQGEVGPFEAVEIATGAPLPKGANAVVKEEYTQRKGEAILVLRAASPGENIHGAGSDIRRGEVVAYRGTMLSAREIGVLAAVGKERVKVFRRPKVGIFSTGDELVPPNEKLDYGKIYDVNSYTVFSSVLEDGGEPENLGILPDSYEEIKKAIERALDGYDLLLLSGSTSVGAGDVIYRILEELGPPGVLVHGIAIHPGKPTVIAEVKGKLVIGLPGYPTSALTIYQALVSPLIRKWSGKSEEGPQVVKAIAAERIFGEKGRKDLLPVHLVRDEDLLTFPVPTGSEAITTLSRADGYIILEKNQEIVEEGEIVEVHLYKDARIADISVMGSHCLGLELLLSELRNRGYNVKVVFLGSTGGFRAVSRREADIAGVHALDPETWEYNIPFLRKFSLEGRATLVRGYVREQGLILPKGNPKGVKSIRDLLERRDLTFINRNKGSGTRILFDALLGREAEALGLPFEEAIKRVKGYWSEAKSHSAVAAAVYYGIADVGLGIKTAAALYGLDFIHITDERYDFLVRNSSMEKKVVRDFLNLLRDPKIIRKLKSLEGIRIDEETGRSTGDLP
ncbi:MAG: molybdopterin biosynthesis protein [Candidatus Korarchaeota archaeon]|nr:molybdopterin biosynthesis protein [Candidatus Korarchaeota archaeon]